VKVGVEGRGRCVRDGIRVPEPLSAGVRDRLNRDAEHRARRDHHEALDVFEKAHDRRESLEPEGLSLPQELRARRRPER